MGPAFANGQWTDGMLAGLEGYAAAYDNPVPRADPDPFPTGINGATAGTGSGGSDVLPWVLGVPVGLAALGGAGVGGTRLRRRLKARSAARASLGSAVNDMAQTWFELDENNELIDARVTALPPVSDAAADAIRATHVEAVTVRNGATDIYLRLSELHTSTAIADLGTEEATQARYDVEVAIRALREAQKAMASVEEQLSAYDTLRDELPGRVEAAFSDEQEARVRGADAALDRAEADLAGHRTWLAELAAFRAALIRDAAQLRTRATELDAAIADAYVTTEGLERDQHPSCVEGVRTTGDRAAGDRTSLDQLLTTIESRSSMGTQQFAQAREEMTAAQQSVDSISADAAAPALRVERLTGAVGGAAAARRGRRRRGRRHPGPGHRLPGGHDVPDRGTRGVDAAGGRGRGG